MDVTHASPSAKSHWPTISPRHSRSARARTAARYSATTARTRAAIAPSDDNEASRPDSVGGTTGHERDSRLPACADVARTPSDSTSRLVAILRLTPAELAPQDPRHLNATHLSSNTVIST
ncbi:hypothetical protein MFU01_44210 [Myxococcus fulvus]|uniref:Uncharacterized protein n=1 Tax=Myxococcus fulvus TaxID=33 RepID=A0A511T5D2_MYXFU|nr:hypothetical protein MFU01_44210 [Myxococcus fulvus]